MTQDTLQLLPKVWKNFLGKFPEIKTIPVYRWKPVHLLAYFCQRYQEHYQIDFSLSFKGAPSKCAEIVFIKKICVMLGTTNPVKAKEYIDWVFEEKIIPKQMKIRTLTFFMTPALSNEFNQIWVKKKVITANTALPADYTTEAEAQGIPITTYGELAFVYQAWKADSTRTEYRTFLTSLEALGLDLFLLEKLA